MTTQELKETLVKNLFAFIEQRHQKVKQTIIDIEESLLEESRSSAGDKHETGRAMLQIDRENAGKQLLEIEKIQQILKRIDLKGSSEYARLGSLVYSEKATYYLSISLGDVVVGKTHYYCVSLDSPIGKLLLGKKKGDQVIFNNKHIKITSVK